MTQSVNNQGRKHVVKAWAFSNLNSFLMFLGFKVTRRFLFLPMNVYSLKDSWMRKDSLILIHTEYWTNWRHQSIECFHKIKLSYMVQDGPFVLLSGCILALPYVHFSIACFLFSYVLFHRAKRDYVRFLSQSQNSIVSFQSGNKWSKYLYEFNSIRMEIKSTSTS